MSDKFYLEVDLTNSKPIEMTDAIRSVMVNPAQAADRIEKLEAALREIELLVTGRAKRLARAALAPEQNE